MGESTLQLAGTLPRKQLCRYGSCLGARFLHDWQGYTSLRSPVFHISQKRSRESQTKQRERSNTVVISSSEYSWWAPQRITLAGSGRAFWLRSLYQPADSLHVSSHLYEEDTPASSEDRNHKEWETFGWPDSSHNLTNIFPSRSSHQCHWNRKQQQVSKEPYNLVKHLAYHQCSTYHLWETTGVFIWIRRTTAKTG